MTRDRGWINGYQKENHSVPMYYLCTLSKVHQIRRLTSHQSITPCLRTSIVLNNSSSLLYQCIVVEIILRETVRLFLLSGHLCSLRKFIPSTSRYFSMYNNSECLLSTGRIVYLSLISGLPLVPVNETSLSISDFRMHPMSAHVMIEYSPGIRRKAIEFLAL